MTSLVEPSKPVRRKSPFGRIPPLENGDHLSASEFLRRYQAMPELNKAELINGIVYLGGPVRFELHGEPHGLASFWLGTYSIGTPGVQAANRSTTRLDADNVAQPDCLLRLLPECGGQSRLDEKGYLQGAPELAVEVAASTASLDAREKLACYRRAGVREYLLWHTEDEALDWFVLEDDDYRPLAPAPDGTLRSKTFPGLWLDPQALLTGDGAKLMAKLQEGLQSAEHAAFAGELKKKRGAEH